MNDSKWGHCNHCKFFESPALAPLGGEEARCLHPALGKHDLRVFGACGCGLFKLRAGLSKDIEQPRART